MFLGVWCSVWLPRKWALKNSGGVSGNSGVWNLWTLPYLSFKNKKISHFLHLSKFLLYIKYRMCLDMIRANFVVKLKKIVVELRFNRLLKTNRKKIKYRKFSKGTLNCMINWLTSNVVKVSAVILLTSQCWVLEDPKFRWVKYTSWLCSLLRRGLPLLCPL